MTAMIAASLAQTEGLTHAIYPSLTGLNPVIPVAAGLMCGLFVGLINGSLIAYTKIPPFIATLGMMVSARGVADWYTNGQPVGNLEDSFAAIGAGWWPVIIFLSVAFIFHIALRYLATASSHTRSARTRWRRASRASTSSVTSCSST
jgi:inositol transport system permease protein